MGTGEASLGGRAEKRERPGSRSCSESGGRPSAGQAGECRGGKQRCLSEQDVLRNEGGEP